MVLGMSTRKGTAKFLDDILRDVGEKMHEVMRTNQAKYEQVEDPEKTADTLGISAVMVQDMKGKRYAYLNFLYLYANIVDFGISIFSYHFWSICGRKEVASS